MASNSTHTMHISGSPVDRRDALSVAAASDALIDIFVGEWMYEPNMLLKAYAVEITKDEELS
jgi:hypothetical protein